MIKKTYPKLHWETGSVFDLYISMMVLHNPERFSLRPSWAAGVRSRIPGSLRTTLETAVQLFGRPFHYLLKLPAPRRAADLIESLTSMSPSRRVESIGISENTSEDIRGILLGSHPNQKWSEAEKKVFLDHAEARAHSYPPGYIELLNKTWAHREEFGQDYLRAIEAYIKYFFAEEEQRILPVLNEGISHAQMRSGSLPFGPMLSELTAGVRYPELENMAELYLAPSFWGTPLMFYEHLPGNSMLILYGCRPDNMALVPGDVVPDTLLRGMKALSDSTRLRILRSLSLNPQSPAQLARSLRLRPSTVSHHIAELRMAGLVHVNVNPEGENLYTTRFEGLEMALSFLKNFVRGD